MSASVRHSNSNSEDKEEAPFVFDSKVKLILIFGAGFLMGIIAILGLYTREFDSSSTLRPDVIKTVDNRAIVDTATQDATAKKHIQSTVFVKPTNVPLIVNGTYHRPGFPWTSNNSSFFWRPFGSNKNATRFNSPLFDGTTIYPHQTKPPLSLQPKPKTSPAAPAASASASKTNIPGSNGAGVRPAPPKPSPTPAKPAATPAASKPSTTPSKPASGAAGLAPSTGPKPIVNKVPVNNAASTTTTTTKPVTTNPAATAPRPVVNKVPVNTVSSSSSSSSSSAATAPKPIVNKVPVNNLAPASTTTTTTAAAAARPVVNKVPVNTATTSTSTSTSTTPIPNKVPVNGAVNMPGANGRGIYPRPINSNRNSNNVNVNSNSNSAAAAGLRGPVANPGVVPPVKKVAVNN